MVCQPFQTSNSSARIGAAGHDLGDVVDVQAGLAIVFTVLAFAVGGVERGRQLIHFGAFFRVGRRGQCESDFQQIQFAGDIGGHLNAVELLGLLGQADGFIAITLAGCSG